MNNNESEKQSEAKSCQSATSESRPVPAERIEEPAPVNRTNFWNVVLSINKAPAVYSETSTPPPAHEVETQREKPSRPVRKRLPVRRIKLKRTSFPCTECTFVFKQANHLKQHIRAVHLLIRPFICSECSRSFAKKHDMETHFAAVHDKERKFNCRFCHKRFSKRYNMARHEENMHFIEVMRSMWHIDMHFWSWDWSIS